MPTLSLRGVGKWPTRDADMFLWWRKALAGEDPPVFENEPQCGFFEIRLAKGGPWVGARIAVRQTLDPLGYLSAPEEMFCEMGPSLYDVASAWPWLCQRPIKKSLYLYLVGRADWAKQFDKTSPLAFPARTIDYATVALPTMPKRKRRRIS